MTANSVTGVGLGAADDVSRTINAKKDINSLNRNSLHPFLISQATSQVDEVIPFLVWTRIRFQQKQSLINGFPQDGENSLNIDTNGIITVPPGHWLINSKVCAHNAGVNPAVFAVHMFNEDTEEEIPYSFTVTIGVQAYNLPIVLYTNTIYCNTSNNIERISLRVFCNVVIGGESNTLHFGFHPDTVPANSTNSAGFISINRVGI